MTVIWVMLAPGNVPVACAAAAWPKMRPCEKRCRPSLSWSGARSQIAAWLRETYPGQPSWHVCHETIYQALYHGGTAGLTRDLTCRLRTGRPLRKRRRRTDHRATRFIAPARLIDHRPAIVELRERVGDWEGDLITGRQNRSAIGTLVDRTSRYLTLVHLPGGHSADELHVAMQQVITTLPGQAWLTLT